MKTPSCSHALGSAVPGSDGLVQPSQMALLDFFFPGFSIFSGIVQKYLHIDLNLYIPLVLFLGGMTFAWRYFSEYFWDRLEAHFMSTVDVRTDDEVYNMLMAWVAIQPLSQGARRFVANTNLNSRSWFLWRWDYGEDEDDEETSSDSGRKKKALSYTPTFGSHCFWYKGRLLVFRRSRNKAAYFIASEKEEISVSCFGRDPWILKELLHEAREQYMKHDESKTLIYRGTTKAGGTEPTWQRCMARTSRPFSTVILNEKAKKDLIDDVTDYLNPATRRWYSNRGIPYRRGYLLYGPPGTGKSSLSLALAGLFKMRIYIVSLSSVSAHEENLATLFADLPRRCVVLLEDIDSAGLTHARDNGPFDDGGNNNNNASNGAMVPNQITRGINNIERLSLSGLLNILDGVASQEGRVLIMTTNHLEKLDQALIRPGRVDMIVKLDLADSSMIAAIFRAIYAPLEGDDAPATAADKALPVDREVEKKKAAEEVMKRDEVISGINVLAEKFAAKVPAHEFSPAEIQGYLMKNKRDPDKALFGVDDWIIETRKAKKKKELKEAEDKRKAEEMAEKKEAKKKEKRKQPKDHECDSDSSDCSEWKSEVEEAMKMKDFPVDEDMP